VLADDVAAVIDAFTDEPAILAGHSYGGFEMPRVATRHPSKVRALIFLDAVYDWSGFPDFPLQPGYAIPDSVYASLDDLKAWYRTALPEFVSPAGLAHLRSLVRVRDDGSVVWQLPFSSPQFMAFANLYGGWSGAEFAGIEVPVLAIEADEEKFLGAHLVRRGLSREVVDSVRRWATEYLGPNKAAGMAMLMDAVPNTVHTVLDSTHHILQLQRPQEVVRLMKAFLASQVEQ